MKKICSKCGQTKPLELFKKRKGCKDSRSPRCRACHSLAVCEHQEKHRDWANVNNRRYKQTAKGRASTKRYKQGEACRLARKRYNDSFLGKAMSARAHAVRASRHLNTIGLNNLTYIQWQNILISQHYRCKICNVRFDISDIRKRAERDHIIPIKNGGALTENNVQALCRSCNSRKGYKNDTDIKDQKANVWTYSI